MIDYHIHTSLCNHASGRMEDYITHAINMGIEEICFMDHLTLQGEGSANTMQRKEIPLYFQAINVLKDRYKGKINIKSGLEVDFDEDLVDDIKEITQKFSFDAISASVHFSGGNNLASRKSIDKIKALNPEDIICSYLEKLNRMLDFDFFDIICHIDLPKKFLGNTLSLSQNSSQDLNLFFSRTLKRAADKGRVVEINTSGKYHPCASFYPEFEILEECRRSGIRITLGSDAHSPNEVGRDLDIAIEMAKKAGYSEICAFTRRKPYFIKI